jgi:phosphoglycolate phosphatase-like HAD superfamily hydrolase
MHRKLVLFDIDGTLISSGGAGVRALKRALVQVFGSAHGLDNLSAAGKTDKQICHEAMQAQGLSRTHVAEQLTQVLEIYLPILEEEMTVPGAFVQPGVHDLLETLQGNDVVYRGLLTGNIDRGARIKLQKFDLWRHFPVGAYGSDSEDRLELPAVAARRAKECFEIDFAPKDVVIIGDAIPDVRCAKAYGATSIAVTTGGTSREVLAAEQPDYLLSNLEDTNAVLDAIL